uniref:FAS2 n=1 Tax=Arundo donax TaxID=35708 RepID=A0A0A9EUY5_ARUDO
MHKKSDMLESVLLTKKI